MVNGFNRVNPSQSDQLGQPGPPNWVNQVNQVNHVNHINHVNHVNQVHQVNQVNLVNQGNQVNQVTQVNQVNIVSKSVRGPEYMRERGSITITGIENIQGDSQNCRYNAPPEVELKTPELGTLSQGIQTHPPCTYLGHLVFR